MRCAWALAWLTLAACQCGPGGPCPNDLPPASGCPGSAPSWDAGLSSTFVAKCAPCHRPGIATSHDYDSYANTRADVSATLNQIYSCNMPPSDAGSAFALTPAERKDALKWLVCGAPDN